MGAGPGVSRSQLNSTVELGYLELHSMPLAPPRCGRSAMAHKPLRLPTTCEAVLPASALPQRV